MSTIASQITSFTIVYSTVYSGADQSKHQSSASLAFVWGIHRGPVNSPHKWPVTRKMFPFDDVIMTAHWINESSMLMHSYIHCQVMTHVLSTLSLWSTIIQLPNDDLGNTLGWIIFRETFHQQTRRQHPRSQEGKYFLGKKPNNDPWYTFSQQSINPGIVLGFPPTTWTIFCLVII